MDNSKEKSIKLSNKIYPIFYGLSSDLIFFIEVNTLFLTTVKGLTTSEINFMTTIGVLVALVFYLLSHKIMIITILVYGLIYGTITVCQTNDKLFIQYELQDFLKSNSVTLVMSIILFLSRVSRLILNLIFEKIYDKFKNRTLYLIYFGLLISVSLFVIGKIFFTSIYSSIIMAIGFILLLALRDPTENLLSDILLKNTNKEDKEKAILYFQFMRRLVVFILSLIATMILVRYELIHLYIVFLIFIILYIFMVLKLLYLVNNQNRN